MKSDYWILRQRELLFQKQLAGTEEELAREYIRTGKQVKSRISTLYDELASGVLHRGGSDRGILVSDLYQFNKYYDLLNMLNESLTKLGSKEIIIYDRKLTQMYLSNSQLITTELGFSKMLSDDSVKTSINAVWCPDGKNWSDRIWNNKALLEERVREGIVDCVARGASKDELVEQVMNDFNVGFNMADRLARTELSYVQNQSTKDKYEEAGIQKYKILDAGDDRTCENCLNDGGKVYYLDEAQVGVNFPPFHPNCRCVILAVLDEEAK